MESAARDLARTVLRRADDLQRRRALFGFPFAVVKKYSEDEGGRHAALITYYGFLSFFPLLLVASAVISRVLVNNPTLRGQLLDALVPSEFHQTVENALVAMPSSGIPLAIGLLGMFFASTGAVFSAYETLNHLAGTPRRLRYGFIPRYARVLLMVGLLLVGELCTAALTVVSGVLPTVSGLRQLGGGLATALVTFVVLVVAAKVLVVGPAPVRASWPAAALGAVCVAAVLTLGTRLLAPLVARSGPVYGSFATVVGVFALLYLVSQALLYSAEVAIVRHRRYWPRALDVSRPTSVDLAALTRLATVQERLPSERIEVRLTALDDDGRDVSGVDAAESRRTED